MKDRWDEGRASAWLGQAVRKRLKGGKTCGTCVYWVDGHCRYGPPNTWYGEGEFGFLGYTKPERDQDCCAQYLECPDED